ncbi:50S ribosomal protein L6 [Candidatus Williamhamiltonella defendens]|uniref:50S ribosomal protein L6 n=1 Tax=Candidatus Williamhamiltonella defendens TaxID=138072 RepID=UPI00130E0C10|nr:50S ribosomal protein L6 [Candidatus Hamiltonella defensa]
MSRVAKTPIVIPDDVEVKLNNQVISIKGKNGALTISVHKAVNINHTGNILTFSARERTTDSWSQAGTTRALLNSMVIGVTEGFTKKLSLAGVGYRAAIQGNTLKLALGYSHPIDHQLPLGVFAECPTQTEIILKSSDKKLISQVAADIRNYRRPEPYKGKGIRYADESVRLKEAKKK